MDATCYVIPRQVLRHPPDAMNPWRDPFSSSPQRWGNDPVSINCTIRYADAASSDLALLAPNDNRRRDSLAGQRAASDAIAAHCGIPPEHIRLEGRIGAGPLCTVRGPLGRWAPLPVSLSLAHSDGLAVAAAGDPGARIGVDLERAGSIGAEHERYFLAPNERAAAPLVDPTLLWVLKEAAWKALGLDATVPFTALELDLAPGTAELRALRVAERTHAAGADVMPFSLRGHEFVAAVVQVAGEPPCT